MANYGGGMVDGDRVRMRVECGPDSRLYLGSQSSTKIYRSDGRGGCGQELSGSVAAGAFAVICPDPVVPYLGSHYAQSQEWSLDENGELAVFDWLQPGRAERGEVFDYAFYQSKLRVRRPGGPLIYTDCLAIDPERQHPTLCGRFGKFQSLLSVYLFGPKLSVMMSTLMAGLKKTGSARAWVTVGERPGVGFTVRAMGMCRQDLQPIQDLLFQNFCRPEWLGFNPWTRRW